MVKFLFTNLLRRVFTYSLAKILGRKTMTAATKAALKNVEKGSNNIVDHDVDKWTSRPLHDFMKRTSPFNKSTPQH